MIVNIHEAKTHLSSLIQRVLAREEVVIARAGRPVARLVPYQESDRPRTPGGWEGTVELGPDFDEPLPEELALAFHANQQ
jgi:prevent-host-death family protein